MKGRFILGASIILSHALVHAMEIKTPNSNPLNVPVAFGECVERVMQQEDRRQALRTFALTLIGKLEKYDTRKQNPALNNLIQSKSLEDLSVFFSHIKSEYDRWVFLKRILKCWEVETFDAIPILDLSGKVKGMDLHLHDPASKELIQLILNEKDIYDFLKKTKILNAKNAYQTLKQDFSRHAELVALQGKPSFCPVSKIFFWEGDLKKIKSQPFIARFGDLFLKYIPHAQEIHSQQCHCEGMSLLHAVAGMNGKLFKYLVEQLRSRSEKIDVKAKARGLTLVGWSQKLKRQAEAIKILIEEDVRISELRDDEQYIPGHARREMNLIYKLCSHHPSEEIVKAAQQTYNELFPK